MVVLGARLKYLFRKYYKDDQLFVVPNGANYRMPSLVKHVSSSRILYLSNIAYSKGIEDVLIALELLETQVGSLFHLDVVGDWRDDFTREKITSFLAEKHLPLTFHGPVTESKRFEFYARADLFVFPPREPEGHPWVIIEAMAAGLPIITTDQGAITESVREGVNGFIVEPGNPYQIAEKIKFLIENPAVKQKMGQESRRLYLENFTEEKMVERLSAAFRAVLAK
jgi:glycosyltransferase involved in cell wall biosynthesis